MKRLQVLAWGAVGFVAAYYVVRHWHVTGGRVA